MVPVRTYSPTFLTLGRHLRKALTDRISVGVTANLVSERILEMSASGVAFNIGIQYQNLGTPGLEPGYRGEEYRDEYAVRRFQSSPVGPRQSTGLRGTQFYSVEAASNEMPSSLEIGLGYTHKFDDQNSATVGGLFRNNNYQEDEYNLGAEYTFDNIWSSCVVATPCRVTRRTMLSASADICTTSRWVPVFITTRAGSI